MSVQSDAIPAPLTGALQPGDVVHDKYRVDRVLGVGGMGVVVEAWHLQLHQKVALKVLQPALGADAEALGRFEREARAVVKIKSEHVTRVLDVGRLSSGTPFIVMEYLEGRDLAMMLKDGYPFPIEEAIAHVLQACEVVAEAHALGIVHRDLKPENLFLTRRNDGSPCIKVLDFGLSKVRSHEDSESRPDRALTAYRQAMGTPNYMSPEQWMSARDVGPAADQWALAIILYELLAGAPAFGGKEIGQVCAKVLNKEPKSLTQLRADVPPGLEQAIARALSKDPAARFPTLYEFAASIGPFGSELSSISVERVAGIFHLSSGEHPAPNFAKLQSEREIADSVAPTVPRMDADSSQPIPGIVAHPAAGAAPAVSEARHQTAQSWQQMLGSERQGRARSAAMIAVVGGLILLSAMALIGIMVSGDNPPESSPSPAVTSAETVAEDAGASTETPEPSAEPAGSVAADATPTAEPTSEASSTRPRPVRRPYRPHRSKPGDKKPSIFDTRQ